MMTAPVPGCEIVGSWSTTYSEELFIEITILTAYCDVQ